MRPITVPNLSKTTPKEPMLEHAIRLRADELYVQRGVMRPHKYRMILKAYDQGRHLRSSGFLLEFGYQRQWRSHSDPVSLDNSFANNRTKVA